MRDHYTPGAQRALDRAGRRARARGGHQTDPSDLVAALIDEAESHAMELLRTYRVDTGRVLSLLGASEGPEVSGGEAADPAPPDSPALRSVLLDASGRARSLDRGRGVGTEHLLWGLAASAGPASEALSEGGLDLARFLGQLEGDERTQLEPIPLAPEIEPLDIAGLAEVVDLGRILDASANRAQEGLRVVDDFVRFILDDPMLARRLKEVRHRLGEAVRGIGADLRLGARDTRGDVGTHIMTASEKTRENPRAVLTANFRRVGEALRSLEEYTKLLDVWLSGRFEVLRYDVYTLEKLVMTSVAARHTLDDARLYVLVGGLPTLGDLTWIVGEALAGGAQVIQLREKGLPDREILRRAREVRILTVQAKARFILNDRPDLARLSGADGVHLGQDDVRPRDARRILGPSPLLGISTHDREQLELAILDGAGYLGVGPVFSSRTKAFDEPVGLGFVRHAAETSTLPWFAIGGIDGENVGDVLDAGARRVAVSSAVTTAERPRVAAANLRKRLDEAG